MDPRLLQYYENELKHLIEMGAEFAQQSPKIAARLGRFKVPDDLFCDHTGDSGRNGLTSISGIAGARPNSST